MRIITEQKYKLFFIHKALVFIKVAAYLFLQHSRRLDQITETPKILSSYTLRLRFKLKKRNPTFILFPDQPLLPGNMSLYISWPSSPTQQTTHLPLQNSLFDSFHTT